MPLKHEAQCRPRSQGPITSVVITFWKVAPSAHSQLPSDDRQFRESGKSRVQPPAAEHGCENQVVRASVCFPF